MTRQLCIPIQDDLHANWDRSMSLLVPPRGGNPLYANEPSLFGEPGDYFYHYSDTLGHSDMFILGWEEARRFYPDELYSARQFEWALCVMHGIKVSVKHIAGGSIPSCGYHLIGYEFVGNEPRVGSPSMYKAVVGYPRKIRKE